MTEPDKEIRVAFTHEKYPAGGAERVTENIARLLAARGFRVYMFVDKLDSELLSESDRRNITFIPVVFWDGEEPVHEQITRHVNSLGIDILVTGVPRFGLIRQNTRCKIVYANHGKPMYQAPEYLANKSLKAIRSRRIDKILFWYLVKHPFELLSGRYKHAITRQYRHNYRSSDLYTVLTEDYRQGVVEILGPRFATRDDNHIEVIPNWIPPCDYGISIPTKRKQVVFLGRLTYSDKRVDRLLDIWNMVWRDHPEWRLLIVGSGDEREFLKRQSARLGLGGVEFRDYTTDPSPYYRDAAILCLTSTFEGWPMVIAEGQQAGVVPIAFDVCAGIRDQITPDGMNGFLVPPFDKKEFARRLSGLMADDQRRHRMSLAAIEKSRAYSHESRLARWEEAFRSLVTNR